MNDEMKKFLDGMKYTATKRGFDPKIEIVYESPITVVFRINGNLLQATFVDMNTNDREVPGQSNMRLYYCFVDDPGYSFLFNSHHDIPIDYYMADAIFENNIEAENFYENIKNVFAKECEKRNGLSKKQLNTLMHEMFRLCEDGPDFDHITKAEFLEIEKIVMAKR